MLPSALEGACMQQYHGSWVVLRDTAEFGCKVCPNMTFRGQVTQFAHLWRHHTNSKHMHHLRAHLGIEVGPTGKPLAGAPPHNAFEQVWQDMTGGTQLEIGCRKKVAQMRTCVFEAMVSEESRFLRDKASSITIFRDESNGRLVIRYMAVSNTLERRCGILGVCRLAGSDAFDITAATGKMLKWFCNFGTDDGHGFHIVKSKIEAICVDSASNETKSATLMKYPANPSQPPLAPNLKAILRDRAHASRRMTCRPWKCDKYLTSVCNTIIMSKSSIVQRIQHSVHLQRRFKHNVHTLETCQIKAVTCLKAARHRDRKSTRLNSSHIPLSRMPSSA